MAHYKPRKKRVFGLLYAANNLLNIIQNEQDPFLIKHHNLNQLLIRVHKYFSFENITPSTKAAIWFLMANIYHVDAKLFYYVKQYEKSYEDCNNSLRCLEEIGTIYQESFREKPIPTGELFKLEGENDPIKAREKLRTTIYDELNRRLFGLFSIPEQVFTSAECDLIASRSTAEAAGSSADAPKGPEKVPETKSASASEQCSSTSEGWGEEMPCYPGAHALIDMMQTQESLLFLRPR